VSRIASDTRPRTHGAASRVWLESWLDHWYRDRPGGVDGTETFHALCARNIPHGHEILEVGPGPGNATSRFLASLGPTHGLDCDPAARTNSSLEVLDELTGLAFPFADACFDAAVSNYVVEHIVDPSNHLREVFRILRPGGVYLFRTPNLHHYVTAVSALTPHWFHIVAADRLRCRPAGTHGPYPTMYRMNTRGAVRHHAEAAGFHVRSVDMVEKEPSYCGLSRALFLAGLAYERTVNCSEALRGFRANIFAVLEKPAA
jgi:SAM-dependent methyltransferase